MCGGKSSAKTRPNENSISGVLRPQRLDLQSPFFIPSLIYFVWNRCIWHCCTWVGRYNDPRGGRYERPGRYFISRSCRNVSTRSWSSTANIQNVHGWFSTTANCITFVWWLAFRHKFHTKKTSKRLCGRYPQRITILR